jgi:ribosomal protein L24
VPTGRTPRRTPGSRYSFSSADQAPRVVHRGLGDYVVTLPGTPKGGVAHVTPFDSNLRRCVVAGIRKTSVPQKVGVRCFRYEGAADDGKFTLAYER